MEKGFFTLLLLTLALLAMAVIPYAVPISKPLSEISISDQKLSAAFPLAFGGNKILTTPCTCSGGFRLQVGPPRPINVLYQPGVSTLFSFYNFLPPGYILGTYSPGGVCIVGAPPATPCAPIPVLGTIIIAGTSAL